MQKGIQPLAEKLATDGATAYTTQSAFSHLADKISSISSADLAVDLLPMFESRTFIESWLEYFHTNFAQYALAYR